MKSAITRLSREPNLVLGVVAALLSLLVLFDVIEVTAEQSAGVGVFIGAIFALVRFLTTPANEVMVQKKPDGEVVGGAAVPEFKGEQIVVGISKVDDFAKNNPPEGHHP